MRLVIKVIAIAAVVIGGWAFSEGGRGPAYSFPWRMAGLTEQQAAAHLISRFTYGVKPGQVDAVVKMGLETWFAKQLEGLMADDSLDQRLGRYDALELSNEEVANTYPRNGQVVRMAIRDGVISKDSVKVDRKEYREVLQNYMQQKGLKREQELFRQFFCQKVLRAAYSENQLREVMTDFWFNHFNVSITKNDCAEFIPSYERDVVRPNALGRFGELLLKTAKSPAMLYYLDNFQSSGPPKGLNENYAREVMELHTLGVDGGYSQQDVTEAARVLTGWGVYPLGQYARGGAVQLARFTDDQIARRGFVHEGDFFFNANRHDKGEKVVLGHVFPAGGGYEEGVTLLNLLAHQPATANRICRKIAVRFVSDDPPASLVDKMAKTFVERNGDIRQVLLTMVGAPEFWSPAALREKTKSPFELAIGAVRGLNGDIRQPMPLFSWVTRMGERKYYYQAPTGFPDRGTYWINTGSLLSRMNFGLALAGGRIPGVRIDLLALNNGHEPESATAALAVYGKLLLPARDLKATEKRLAPLLNDKELAQRVNKAASDSTMVDMPVDDNSMLAQTVGILIGSPEFQRR
ncbi:DUF1800 domain-containing protein [Puia sp.]|jgi:uncharacterized protein (DUF1800 family)|uniref:DUF1800 domain-containing protein n=1 Tax=Puia sp. TaxID=2045100 RepID=UPI002F430097